MTARTRALAALLCLAGCAAPSPPPDRAGALHREAMDRLTQGGKPEASLALLDEAIRLDPARPEPYRSRSLIHRLLGQLRSSIADLSAALRREKNPVVRATDLLNRALLQEESGRPTRAIADIGAAIEAYPDYIEAYLQRARLQRANDHPVEAEQDLAEARRRGASVAVRFYNEGIRLLRLGQPEEAARMLSFSIDLDDRKPFAHVALGRACMESRRFEEAELAYGSALALLPDNAQVLYHRGNARLAAGRRDDALEDFDRSVKLDPKQAAVLTARANLLLLHRKDPEGALADYTAALELDPAYRPALLKRGRLHHDAGRLDEAEADLVAALKVKADVETTLELAGVIQAKGDTERAESLCHEALKLSGGDADLERRIRDALERIRKSAQK